MKLEKIVISVSLVGGNIANMYPANPSILDGVVADNKRMDQSGQNSALRDTRSPATGVTSKAPGFQQ